MLEMLKSWVINIASLVILIVMLEIFVPNGKLKKLISLIAGFILIIAIITPVLGFLKKGGELKDFQISQTTFLNQKELEVSAGNVSKKQSQVILSTYKNKLIKDIQENVKTLADISEVKAEVIVEENSDSKEFGIIKEIVVNIKPKNEKESDITKPVISIKKIKLGEKEKEESFENTSVISEKLSEEVKSKLCKLYNINSNQISVSGL